jgi:hypothetical protein
MKTVTIILLLAITALAGCSAPRTSSTDAPPTEGSPSETKSQTEEAGGIAQDVLIVLKRSGGIAGVDESWRISADGLITTSDGKESQVSTEALHAGVDELDSLGFFEMDSSYMPLDTCCDWFTYQLSVTANGKTHAVTALEGAQETPQDFWKAIEIVTGLLKEQQ